MSKHALFADGLFGCALTSRALRKIKIQRPSS